MEFRGRGRLFSYGLAASVTFIWSVTFVSTKYLLGWLEPGEILLYRVAVAFCFTASPSLTRFSSRSARGRCLARGCARSCVSPRRGCSA